jgi:hypothetical protein
MQSRRGVKSCLRDARENRGFPRNRASPVPGEAEKAALVQAEALPAPKGSFIRYRAAFFTMVE